MITKTNTKTDTALSGKGFYVVETPMGERYTRNGDDFVPQGHGGSHPYLVHEFVSSVAEHRQSIINPWIAARFMTMGVMAHKSALRDGETLNVPDWGLPPQ